MLNSLVERGADPVDERGAGMRSIRPPGACRVTHPNGAGGSQRVSVLVKDVSDTRQATEEEYALRRKVDALAREIAEAINTSPADEREVLREFAVSQVRDQVRIIDTRALAASSRPASFSPLAIAIPFFMMGTVLLFLFPLMGLAMFGAAAIMVGWGVLTALFSRSR